MAKDCKCKEVECEECPEWIFTLADLIMCMMGLFVILWVLKPEPEKKIQTNDDLNKVVAAIRDAFKYIPDPESKDPVDLEMLKQKLAQLAPQKGPGEGGETTQKRESPKGTNDDSTSIRPGKISVVGGRLTFEAGEVKFPPAMAHTLDQVADLVRGHRNIVIVRGHTSFDDLGEESTPQQRMDLSIKRAQAVADYLISKNVEPDIVRVQGCSTFEPVSRGEYTPEAVAQNRRVEIEATSSLVDDRAEKPKGAAREKEESAPDDSEIEKKPDEKKPDVKKGEHEASPVANVPVEH